MKKISIILEERFEVLPHIKEIVRILYDEGYTVEVYDSTSTIQYYSEPVYVASQAIQLPIDPIGDELDRNDHEITENEMNELFQQDHDDQNKEVDDETDIREREYRSDGYNRPIDP